MMEQVLGTVRRHALIPRECHVLAGVSGGADSVALAHALHYLQAQQPFSLTIAHLHHGIRGRAADRDRDFVRLLAWRLGAPCVDEEADVPALAARRGISLEMAGREARRAFFRRVALRVGADRVATAHTADDEVETFFLRLLRGAGAQGLGGLPPAAGWDGLVLVRPLIDVTKAEVQGFLRAHGLGWCEDASNRDRRILRNRVRHELLPYVERKFQPALRAITRRTAALLREEHGWLDAAAGERLARAVDRRRPGALTAAAVRALPAVLRRRVLMRWMAGAGYELERLDFETLDRLARWSGGAGGARLSLPGGWLAARSGGALVLHRGPQRPAPFSAALPVPGRVELTGPCLRVRAERARGVVRPPRARIGQAPAQATIRADRVPAEGLVVRSWRAGDRIAPWGMAGSVKLQDLFVDQKVPREERTRVPVVACGEEIVWVPGYRIARVWAVPSARSPSILLTVDRMDGGPAGDAAEAAARRG